MANKHTPEIVSPRVMSMLNRRLNELDITKSDFIRRFHAEHGENFGARNHLFKILGGQAMVGERSLLPPIIQTLKLDKGEAIANLHADKAARKKWTPPRYSKIVQEVADLMEPLSRRDQEEILQIARMKGRS